MTWILFLGTFAISLIAAARVKANFFRFSRVPAASGLSGAEVATAILRQSGIHDVEVVPANGLLADHYDPTRKQLVLSGDNYSGRSVAALGIAAHETGHAIQHAQGYAPLKMRMAAVGLTTIASQLVMAFNLVTLPVEFDASLRAKRLLLQMQLISPGAEANGVNKVLNAAAWTYVAAFLTSLAYFLWFLLPLLSGQRRD
jgi:Zn-dependent membrane protease YugP